jgi:ABC-type glutathione transport system ATPase component
MLKVNIENITLSNNRDRYLLLQDIYFETFYGKVYTILGRNGAGKSTLIKSLTGLLNENIFNINGTVLFEGKDIFSCSEDGLRSIREFSIRYVFQDAANCFDPLKSFKYYFDNSGADKNKKVELLNYFLLPPYDEIVNLFPYEVSGGMAQRLSLVLALLAEPELLILDEPTSGIDYTVLNLLLFKLKQFSKEEKKTVLLVTQDIKFAEKVSDEIAFLSKGTLSSFKENDDFFKHTDGEVLQSFINSFSELA